MKYNDIYRLCQIKDELQALVREASIIMDKDGGFLNDQAQAYWIAQMNMAIGGNSMCNMEETLSKLSEDEDKDAEQINSR